MFGLGIGEMIIILVIVLVIFGAGKLPEIGSGLGRGIRGFQREIKRPDEIDITPKDEEDEQGEKSADSGDAEAGSEEERKQEPKTGSS